MQARLAAVATLDAAALEREEVAVLGRKQGELTRQLRELASLPARRERRTVGAALNALKLQFEAAFAARRGGARPAQRRCRGGARRPHHAGRAATGSARRHPVTMVIADEVVAIFRELGFAVALGPDIENEERNFTALNFPPDHPALDMHDTLYLEERGTPGGGGERLLLRTHTSPVQIRVMRAGPPPHRVVIPGFSYRKDPFDASHAPAFTQIEGLAVDEGITFADLKATLTHFARRFSRRRHRASGSGRPTSRSPNRRPRWTCRACSAAARGCPACKGTGWMEILGCGMVHEQVLRNCGIDPERYTGFAFGMGPHRMAMVRYGIPDIRLLFGGDMRFLAPVRADRRMNVSRRWLEAFLRRPARGRRRCGAPGDARRAGRRHRTARRRAWRRSWSGW